MFWGCPFHWQASSGRFDCICLNEFIHLEWFKVMRKAGVANGRERHHGSVLGSTRVFTASRWPAWAFFTESGWPAQSFWGSACPGAGDAAGWRASPGILTPTPSASRPCSGSEEGAFGSDFHAFWPTGCFLAPRALVSWNCSGVFKYASHFRPWQHQPLAGMWKSLASESDKRGLKYESDFFLELCPSARSCLRTQSLPLESGGGEECLRRLVGGLHEIRYVTSLTCKLWGIPGSPQL